ncbi:MAG: hypothetical protein HQK54_14265 [Oligoflexales bacterium]|nr:hypothetical protein [Oligoflexales bacterium]
MKLTHWTFFLLIISFLLGAREKVESPNVLSSYFIEGLSESTMNQVSDRFEIVRRLSGGFVVYVPQDKRYEFLTLAPRARLMEDDISQELKRNLWSNPDYLQGYRSYDEIEKYLKNLEENHPDIVKLETYGKSRQGLPLYVFKISDHVKENESDEPNLMIDAATHGDEIITTEVLIRLISEIVDSYGNDRRTTRMVDSTQLHFIPVVNADGFVSRQRYEGGVDPNRDYPYLTNPNKKSVACIKAIMDFANSHALKGSIDLHAYGGMVMYPWAYTYDEIADQAMKKAFDELTTRMAEINGYSHGQISKVIYLAKGSSSDYYYWKNKTMAIAAEIADSKAPSSEKIPQYVDDAREMVFRFIEHFETSPAM